MLQLWERRDELSLVSAAFTLTNFS